MNIIDAYKSAKPGQSIRSKYGIIPVPVKAEDLIGFYKAIGETEYGSLLADDWEVVKTKQRVSFPYKAWLNTIQSKVGQIPEDAQVTIEWEE